MNSSSSCRTSIVTDRRDTATRPDDGIDILLSVADGDVRRTLQQTLRSSRLGHRLTLVDSAEAMFRYLEDTIQRARPLPNLVLLGLDRDGGEDVRVMQALKADPELRPIPVIVLVGRGDGIRTRQLYELGASSVVRLPLHFADLVDIMRVLERYWGTVARLPGTDR